MPRALLFAGLVACLAGADWPRFRGPNGAGVADVSPELFAADPKAAKWAIDIPPGYSSPVVAGGLIFLQSAKPDGSARTLHALDAVTGKETWARSRPGKVGHTHKKNSLATGTPAADAAQVYAAFWDGGNLELVAYTHSGAEKWAADLGPFESQHGPALSPVVHGGKVFVNVDQDGDAKLLAFHAADGKPAWSGKRKAFRASYSAPLLRTAPGGTVELVVVSTAGLAGHDPDTGAVRWSWDWPFDGQALRAVGNPALVGDTVIAAAGDGNGSRSMVCVKPEGARAKLVWELRKQTPYVPSVLVHDKHLYWITDDGFATCTDPADGKIAWRERLFSRAVSASPVLAGGVIFAVAEDGQTAAFQATPKGFERVHESKLAGTVIASPALADGRLYVRAGGKLMCWGK